MHVVNLMTILLPENWVWCELCQTVAYKLPCCGNPTCNGGGCTNPICDEIWIVAQEAIKLGNHPSKDKLPVIGQAMEL